MFFCRDSRQGRGVLEKIENDPGTDPTNHLKDLNMISTRKGPEDNKNNQSIERDPKVTISDSLIIDIDGIIDNDDEVSLQTPVTIPESSGPDEFGRAVQDALKERFDDVTKNNDKDSASRGLKEEPTDKLNKMPKPKKKANNGKTLKPPDHKTKSHLNSDNTSDSSTKTSSDSQVGSQNPSLKAVIARKGGVGRSGRNPRKEGPFIGSNDVTSAPRKQTAKKQNAGNPIAAPSLKNVEQPGKANGNHNKIDIEKMQNEMGDVFEPELLPDYAKSYILPKRMYRKPDYKEEEDVYRKQGQDTGLPKSKSDAVEGSRKQSVANADFQFSMLKASLDYDAELFGNQDVKNEEEANEDDDAKEDGGKLFPEVEKRKSKSLVPCISPGKMLDYAKYTQDGGYVPEAVRNAQVGF